MKHSRCTNKGGKRVKILRTNKGGKHTSTEINRFIEEHGIIQQRTLYDAT